jgi:hypothetical protein
VCSPSHLLHAIMSDSAKMADVLANGIGYKTSWEPGGGGVKILITDLSYGCLLFNASQATPAKLRLRQHCRIVILPDVRGCWSRDGKEL